MNITRRLFLRALVGAAVSAPALAKIIGRGAPSTKELIAQGTPALKPIKTIPCDYYVPTYGDPWKEIQFGDGLFVRVHKHS